MALSLLLLVLATGLLLCFLFIIRLCIVVKNGSTRVPGNRAPVAVLAVAGSGNANVIYVVQVAQRASSSVVSFLYFRLGPLCLNGIGGILF